MRPDRKSYSEKVHSFSVPLRSLDAGHALGDGESGPNFGIVKLRCFTWK